VCVLCGTDVAGGGSWLVLEREQLAWFAEGAVCFLGFEGSAPSGSAPFKGNLVCVLALPAIDPAGVKERRGERC